MPGTVFNSTTLGVHLYSIGQNPATIASGAIITNVAAGIFGVPVNFIVTYAVSKLTAPPSAAAQALVDTLRQP